MRARHPTPLPMVTRVPTRSAISPAPSVAWISRRWPKLDWEMFSISRAWTPDPGATAAWGIMQPASAGKDSIAGHWEIAGVHLSRPFPTYPAGFPAEVVEEFQRLTGRGVIGNVVGSGTEMLDKYAEEHLATGSWILYTSADSVFQLAAHEGVVPLEELYRACETARAMLVPPHDVSRVIARPFDGTPGAFARTSNRRDYSIEPPEETLLDALAAAGIDRAGVGKVDDLFAGRSIVAPHIVQC